MHKRTLLFLASAAVGIVACGLANRDKILNQDPALYSGGGRMSKKVADEQPAQPVHFPNSAEDQVPPNNDQPKQIVENPNPPPPKVPTQYDTKALDDKVIEQATIFGEDPKAYRMHVHTNPDGAEVYRAIGMHIIVSRNGEEVFLPDQI